MWQNLHSFIPHLSFDLCTALEIQNFEMFEVFSFHKRTKPIKNPIHKQDKLLYYPVIDSEVGRRLLESSYNFEKSNELEPPKLCSVTRPISLN